MNALAKSGNTLEKNIIKTLNLIEIQNFIEMYVNFLF